MTDAFWTFAATTATTVGTVAAAYYAWQSKRQSKANSKELREVHAKVNGDLERKIADARRQACPQVLIVDDDIYDLLLMTNVLKTFGAEVIEARTAEEAQEVIQSRVGSGRGLPFDIALVDLKLPGSDAGEVIRVFDRIAPWVPIAVITGALRDDLVEKIAKIRPVTILLKPLDEGMAEKLLRQYHIPFTRN